MEAAVQTKSIDHQGPAVSKGRLWTGRVLAGLVILFMLMDAVMKLLKPQPVVDAFVHTGWAIELSVPVGVILLVCTILFAIPRTMILGGILLTAYLGGAVAENVRLQEPLFSHTLFPVYFGVLLWASLLLRRPRLGEFFPLTQAG